MMIEIVLSYLHWKSLFLCLWIMLLSAGQAIMGYEIFRYTFGRVIYRLMHRSQPVDEDNLLPFHQNPAAFFLLGLLCHLTLFLICTSLGFSNWIAMGIPMGVLLLSLCRSFWRRRRSSIGPELFSQQFSGLSSRLFSELRCLGCLMHWHYAIWLLVIILLGGSLFIADDSIKTPWMNNYGDLAFHLGMITHLTFGPDFPPEYHLFAGESLSYPFFINLWTSILWAPFSELATLPTVFLWQWVILWTILYFSFDAKKNLYLPWLLLLGGGSYIAIALKPEEWSWRLINEGYPWTTLLSTVWVTQRSALMGAAVSAVAIRLVFSINQQENMVDSQRRWAVNLQYAFIAGSLIAFSPLVHTHFFMVCALFCGAYLLLKCVRCDDVRFHLSIPAVSTSSDALSIRSVRSWWNNHEAQSFIVLFFTACLAMCFFPLLSGKSSMIQFMYGWLVPLPKPPVFEHIIQSTALWLSNAGHWLFIWALLWVLSRKHQAFLIVTILFLLGNLVLLSGWEWDQIKVFLAIYLVFLMIWSQINSSTVKRVSGLCALVLAGPGAYELYRIYESKPLFTLYDSNTVSLSKVIQEVTAQESIIAVAPDHNNVITLSGRRQFMGYPGTLASHNIDYGERERVMKDLKKIASCAENASAKTQAYCPEYLVWDTSAIRYWKRQHPGAGFEPVSIPNELLKRVGYKGKRPFLYRISNQ